MNTNIITSLDWFALGSFVLLTLIFSYQAWVNLFYGKVSRFSIDAIMVYLFLKFGSEKLASVSKHLPKIQIGFFFLEFIRYFLLLGEFMQLFGGSKESFHNFLLT